MVGGLGGAVAELVMEEDLDPVPFKRIGLDNVFSSKVGDQNYLRAEYGLDAAGILATVENFWQTRLQAGIASSIAY